MMDTTAVECLMNKSLCQSLPLLEFNGSHPFSDGLKGLGFSIFLPSESVQHLGKYLSWSRTMSSE